MILQIKNQLNQANLGIIDINGGNAELDKVSFRSLKEHWINNHPNWHSAVNTLQNLTEEFYDEASNIRPNALEVRDGKVVIPEGTPIHSTKAVEGNNNTGYSIRNSLKSISVAGILASEWFGELESEGECTFCASLATVRNNLNPDYRDRILEQNNRVRDTGFCLYFDINNPLMQKLLCLDYYEYARMKKEEPEKINQKYTKEEIEIFETIILPYSTSGASFHYKEGEKSKFYDWLAIPGGVPPQLINGISIGHKNPAIEFVYEISEMFPYATIFDENGVVLALPKNKNENDSERKAKIEKHMTTYKLQAELDDKTLILKNIIKEITNSKKTISENFEGFKNTKYASKFVELYNAVNSIADKDLEGLQQKIEVLNSLKTKSKNEDIAKQIGIIDLQIQHFKEIKNPRSPLNIMKSISTDIDLIIHPEKFQGDMTEQMKKMYENHIENDQKLIEKYINEKTTGKDAPVKK